MRRELSLALRTDAIGIFAVLFFSGVTQITRPPGSLVHQLPLVFAYTWVASLVFFGALGLIATLLPRSKQILGMGLEVVARFGLGTAALVYSLGVYREFGAEGARFVVLTYLGIAVLMFVGAYRIAVWLHQQREAVDAVLSAREEANS